MSTLTPAPAPTRSNIKSPQQHNIDFNTSTAHSNLNNKVRLPIQEITMNIPLFIFWLFIDTIVILLSFSALSVYSAYTTQIIGILRLADYPWLQLVLGAAFYASVSGGWMYPPVCLALVIGTCASASLWISTRLDELAIRVRNNWKSFKAGGKKCFAFRRRSVFSILAVLALASLAVQLSTCTSLRLGLTTSGYNLHLSLKGASHSFDLPNSVVSLVDAYNFAQHGSRGTQLWTCVNEDGTVGQHAKWTVPMEFYMQCTEVEIPEYEKICNAEGRMDRVTCMSVHATRSLSSILMDRSSQFVTSTRAKFSYTRAPTTEEVAAVVIKLVVVLLLANILFQVKLLVTRHALSKRTSDLRNRKRLLADANYHLSNEIRSLRQALRANIAGTRDARRSKRSMRLALERKMRFERAEKESRMVSRESSAEPESVASSSREGTPDTFTFDDDSVSNASDMTLPSDIEEEEPELISNVNIDVDVDYAKAAPRGAVDSDCDSDTEVPILISSLDTVVPLPLAPTGAPTTPTRKMLPPRKRLDVSPFCAFRAMRARAAAAREERGDAYRGESLDVDLID